MADAGDLSVELQEAHVAAGLRRIDPVIPAGVAGECDECGEDMPRLVDGRCGFCRDGRRPPLSRYDAAPAPVPVTPSPAQEPVPMPSLPVTSDSQTIAVPAKGAVLHAIRRRAAETDEPLGRAVIALIQDALAAPNAEEVLLANLPDKQLIEELIRRFDSCVGSDDYNAALARAEAAEARLAAIGNMLTGNGPSRG